MNPNQLKLITVPSFKWYSVFTEAKKDLTADIKELIDWGYHLEFSSDWKRFRRLEDYFLK